MLIRRLVLVLIAACLLMVAPVAADEPPPVQILERTPQLPADNDPWWCSPAAAWTARQQFERAEGIFYQRCLERAALRAAATTTTG